MKKSVIIFVIVLSVIMSLQVSAQLKLDSNELYENYLIFQNGFHIDGFIRLENTTEDVVSVGMPFMGFYGNWTQAPVFDTTMYDEGGICGRKSLRRCFHYEFSQRSRR